MTHYKVGNESALCGAHVSWMDLCSSRKDVSCPECIRLLNNEKVKKNDKAELLAIAEQLDEALTLVLSGIAPQRERVFLSVFNGLIGRGEGSPLKFNKQSVVSSEDYIKLANVLTNQIIEAGVLD